MSRASLEQERVYQLVRQRFCLEKGRTRRGLSRRKLAEDLGVGPACIRAVLHRLEGEGLIESRPKSGTRLREVDATEYHEIHDIRELIEPYAARRAAWWITPAQIERLWESCVQCEEILADLEGKERATGMSPRTRKKGQAMEVAFHGTILEAAQNGTAARILENLHMLSVVAFYARQHSPAIQVDNARRTLAEHRAVAEAIAARDADEAERRMRLHMNNARNRSHAGLPLAELRTLTTL